MKKIILAGLCGMMLLFGSCESYDNIEPEKYNKIISLQNAGEQSLDLYRTGENTIYTITAMKGGYTPDVAAKATVSVMNESEFAEYKEISGQDYKILPAECYTLNNAELDFTPADRWKKAELAVNPNIVEKYVKDGTEGYVIPLIAKSATDSILASANMIILKPKAVIDPTVSFKNLTGNTLTTEMESGGGTIELPMAMQVDNLWDFTIRVEVDPATTTMPKENFELDNEGKVVFEKGKNGKLTIKVKKLETIVNNKIGLKVSGIEGKSFAYPKDAVCVNILGPKFPLKADMLSSNATEPSEGSLANLLDGNISTYFHSAWSVSISGKHWLQVNLPESTNYFQFNYTNRQNNGNAALKDFDVMVGPDDSHLTLLRNFTLNDGLPTGGAGTFVSPELKTEQPIKVIRFICNQSFGGKFWVWSELSIRHL